MNPQLDTQSLLALAEGANVAGFSAGRSEGMAQGVVIALGIVAAFIGVLVVLGSQQTVPPTQPVVSSTSNTQQQTYNPYDAFLPDKGRWQ